MKLGGSVLTDKTRHRTPRHDVLDRLAAELAQAPGPLVVVHGAGSYGHVVAREHALTRGDDGAAPRRLGFAQVHAEVRELTNLVLAALRRAGLPAVSHSTYDLARLQGGELLYFAHGAVAETLAAGFVPVLSGDGVLDAARGYGILSGDVLMVELARALRPRQVAFVTDVDGVHDRDPREPGAVLLQDVRDAAPGGAAVGGAARAPDVTGGMAGKVRRAREAARAGGVPVHVVNGLAPGRLADLLAGKPVPGTVVHP